jgi:DNA-binding NarL/FixJ family response regulator
MITVVLVEVHPLVRRAARRFLNAAPGIRVVGEAEDGRQALVLVPELQPDVVVMDVVMPDMDGLEVAAQLCHSQGLQIRVLIYSLYATPRLVGAALRKGASGYVLKYSAAQELVDAVVTVSQGRRYLSASTLR